MYSSLFTRIFPENKKKQKKQKKQKIRIHSYSHILTLTILDNITNPPVFFYFSSNPPKISHTQVSFYLFGADISPS